MSKTNTRSNGKLDSVSVEHAALIRICGHYRDRIDQPFKRQTAKQAGLQSTWGTHGTD